MNATHPVAKVLYKGKDNRVLVIGFKSGMKLEEHRAHLPSKLTVLRGKVLYEQHNKVVMLSAYDEVEIPADNDRTVEAIVDSLCLLT